MVLNLMTSAGLSWSSLLDVESLVLSTVQFSTRPQDCAAGALLWAVAAVHLPYTLGRGEEGRLSECARGVSWLCSFPLPAGRTNGGPLPRNSSVSFRPLARPFTSRRSSCT